MKINQPLKPYHFMFIITTAIGVVYFLVIASLTAHGPPTSTNSIVMYNAGWGNSLIAIISPLIALFMLIKEADSKLMSILVWISFVVGVALCLVTLTRGVTWIASNNTEKTQEVKDFTYLKDKKERQAAPYAVYISTTQSCCGVNSFHDWIEIYKEVDDADKTAHSIIRPRKLPDFCCKKDSKDTFHGCGNRAIDSIRETLANAKSNCSETDEKRRASAEKCLDYAKLLNFPELPSVDANTPEAYDARTSALKALTALNNSADGKILAWVTDPRIDPGNHRESLKALPHITRLCKSVKEKLSVFILYGGKVQKHSGPTDNKIIFIKNWEKYTPCSPQDVKKEIDMIADKTATTRTCIDEVIPLIHFEHKFSFCQWLYAKQTSSGEDEIKLEGPEIQQMINDEGKIYTKGCDTFVIKFINDFVASTFTFATILLILYFTDMMAFTHNYLTFVEAHLRIQPMPRWYEPLPNENPPMHSYGDVGFIPDVGCRTLPLPPVRPRMELINKS